MREAVAPAPPTAAANSYAAVMAKYSERVAALVEKHVVRRVEVGQLPNYIDLQVSLDALAHRYESVGRRIARDVSRLGRTETERMLNVGFSSTLGRVEGERAFTEAWGKRQVQLLSNIGAAQVRKVEELVSAGADPDQLRQALWVSRNRAQMVAHNEVHALGTDVVGYWSQEAGSEGYYWVTARDERVRPGHAVLDGKAFAWNDPPNTGRREGNNHPGHAPSCRCRALPIEAL